MVVLCRPATCPHHGQRYLQPHTELVSDLIIDGDTERLAVDDCERDAEPGGVCLVDCLCCFSVVDRVRFRVGHAHAASDAVAYREPVVDA
jgi:hypothetical protein